jgi:hypothetical protein
VEADSSRDEVWSTQYKMWVAWQTTISKHDAEDDGRVDDLAVSVYVVEGVTEGKYRVD